MLKCPFVPLHIILCLIVTSYPACSRCSHVAWFQTCPPSFLLSCLGWGLGAGYAELHVLVLVLNNNVVFQNNL